MTKAIEQLNRELKEARRKYMQEEALTHDECMILVLRQEMSPLQWCLHDICLTERYFMYLKLMGKENAGISNPGNEMDAENYLRFIGNWVRDPFDSKNFWNENFDISKIFRKYQN